MTITSSHISDDWPITLVAGSQSQTQLSDSQKFFKLGLDLTVVGLVELDWSCRKWGHLSLELPRRSMKYDRES